MKQQKQQQFTYKPEILVEMAQEHLNAAHNLMWFIRRNTSPYGDFFLSYVKDRIADSTKNEACRRTWSALRDACNMVDADMSVVLTTVKALDRHEKRQRQQRHWWTAVHRVRGDYADVIRSREAAMRRNFAKLGKHSTFIPLDDGKRRPWMV